MLTLRASNNFREIRWQLLQSRETSGDEDMLPAYSKNRLSISLLLLILVSLSQANAGVPQHVHANAILAQYAPSPSMPLPAPIPPYSMQFAPISGVLRVAVIAAAFPNVSFTTSLTDQASVLRYGRELLP
jgi:hypothetical protein